MRTKTLELYTYDELSPEIQAKVIRDWRANIDWTDYEHELDEGLQSIETFCNHFGIEVKECHMNAFQRAYIITDGTPKHFRNVKLASIDREYMPTGYFIDGYLWETFYDEFKESGNAYHSFECALETTILAVQRACEDYYEDDSIIARIESNEDEFLEDGTLA